MISNKFYTIGHSNLPIDDFIDMLKINKINCLVDVRSIPGSTKYPHYNKENLIDSLDKFNIKYIHISKLGGLRNKNKEIDPKLNNFWQNKSFKNYADYAYSSEDFIKGLNELINLSKRFSCAIMCAEVLWWRCHRRIITDYLITFNNDVYHIMNYKKIDKAVINSNAIVKNNRITYK